MESKKILIIEDELNLRKGIANILDFEGYQVIDAENGREGLQKALEYIPDLILCDIMMPEMDGHQVLQELSKNERTKLIPFIFLTAMADKHDIRVGMESGADDYILKPFTRDDLLNAVKKRLDKKQEIEKVHKSDMDDLRKRILTHIPHELLTPLNGIIGFSEFLVDNAEEMEIAEITDIAKNINLSGERLLELINHYLMYIQITSKHKSDFIKNRIDDVNNLILEAATNISIKNNRPDDLKLNFSDSYCFFGVLEFRIILNELIDNAFKFSTSGNEVRINTNIKQNFFQLQIFNQGIEFPENAFDKIGAFIQFNRSVQEQQGSGLGLIISKLLIERFDGILKIESFKNLGTTLTIQLPL
jgi:CheY-like chemotaxis protein